MLERETKIELISLGSGPGHAIEAEGYSNMSRFQHCSNAWLRVCRIVTAFAVALFDTLQVRKLGDRPELILEALDDYLMDEGGAECTECVQTYVTRESEK
jgi:hypothetical protein